MVSCYRDLWTLQHQGHNSSVVDPVKNLPFLEKKEVVICGWSAKWVFFL